MKWTNEINTKLRTSIHSIIWISNNKICLMKCADFLYKAKNNFVVEVVVFSKQLVDTSLRIFPHWRLWNHNVKCRLDKILFLSNFIAMYVVVMFCWCSNDSNMVEFFSWKSLSKVSDVMWCGWTQIFIS